MTLYNNYTLNINLWVSSNEATFWRSLACNPLEEIILEGLKCLLEELIDN